MQTKPFRDKLIPLLLVVLLQSCGLAGQASLPSISNDTSWGRSTICFFQGCSDPMIRLRKDQIELTIKSHNARYLHSGDEYFAVSLFFKTPVTLTMDLSKIELISSNGEKRTPKGFIMRKFAFPESGTDRCLIENYYSRGDIQRYPGYQGKAQTVFRVMSDFCYDIFFAEPVPKPRELFYLNLAGIVDEGKRVQIPPMKFE